MFRPTTAIGLMGAIVVGMIVADIWRNPAGTTAAGNSLVNVIKPTEQGLTGQAIG